MTRQIKLKLAVTLIYNFFGARILCRSRHLNCNIPPYKETSTLTVSILGFLEVVAIPLCHLERFPLRLRLKFQTMHVKIKRHVQMQNKQCIIRWKSSEITTFALTH